MVQRNLNYAALICSIVLLVVAPGCTQWRTQSHLERAESLVHEMNLRYQQEYHLLAQYATKEERQTALKDIILIQHEYYLQTESAWTIRYDSKVYRCYPFIRYKKIVNNDIARLKKAFVRISVCATPLAQELLHQLQDLELILTLIVTFDAYQEEEKTWQQHKQQEELNTLLHKQNEYLKEQNNLLKKQKNDTRAADDANAGTIITPAYAPYTNHINPPRG